ncbi:glycoside hydrolase family 127 protein [Flavobacterium sp. Root420]|uniref:glycoside hydrolase family 127 protein n=1 Tax=Flavobacterium sp. Root420 TaxID=1736533 RepID=UPI0006FB5EA5|nr:glycoside hydrolase family 127 protein [Flavobacterium sp. Root420]KQX14412.1 six-hairpin glycosidase [Flavobacterium sp. Root420]
MKNFIFLLVSLFIVACTKAQTKYNDYPVKAVNIQNVVLTDSFWLPKIKVIQNTTIPYAFDKCSKEGRMESFLIAGGIKKGTVRGKMPWDDSDLYKIIEGASYSLINNPNPGLLAYLDSVIGIIKIGQEKDGYITTWMTIDPTTSPADWYKPAGKRWAGESASHELYNSGHLFEAAAAHYIATGKRNFLDIAIKNADLLVATFGPGKLQIPPGHQIVETGLIKLYLITKNQKYLELAKLYLDWRGDPMTHQLYGSSNQDHLPVVKQEEVVGHAVRAVYLYAGMTDIAAIYKDPAYLNATNKLWENMVNKKMYITGGIGSRHEGEAFGDNYELPNLTAYNETCAAIGSVYWNHRLFLLTGESKYYDIIERTLYNGLLAGISLTGDKFFYPNPLESDGQYTFNHGSCTRQSWFECSCCPTNLIRFLPSIPGLVYATHENDLYVNLFMSNQAKLTVGDKKVEVKQQTGYPWNGQVTIDVNPEKTAAFTLKVRIPGWAVNKPVPGTLYQYIGENTGIMNLKINGKNENLTMNNGYLEIKRQWSKGDKIELSVPMHVRRVITNEKVQSDKDLVALEYGPIVYCTEQIDNTGQLAEMTIHDNDEFFVENKNILSNQVNILKGNIVGLKGTDKPVFIPYYTWSNRGVGKMKVWLSRKVE